jgi:hypothetical protein
MSGLIRALREIIEPQADPAQDRRITRRPSSACSTRSISPRAWNEAASPLSRMPAIDQFRRSASGASDRAGAARFRESRAQFGKKRLIIASRHRQLRIYRIAKISHVVDGGP